MSGFNRSDPKLERLSRFLCLILRHRPEVVNIKLTDDGFADFQDILSAIKHHDHYQWVTEDELWFIIQNDPKERYEVVEGQVRAAYGHSIPIKFDFSDSDPSQLPPALYHGTSPDAAWRILKQGLTPQQRQFVHLSESLEQATEVGKRHSQGGQPVLFVIDVKKAISNGILFRRGGKGVYISNIAIKPDFIQIYDVEDSS